MHGFILCRQWSDVDHALQLEFWLSTANGPRCLKFPKQEAVSFIKQADTALLPNWPGLRFEAVALKHFNQTPVAAVYCGSYKTLTRLKRYCEEQQLTLWEADIKPTERFMMERFIHGSLEFQEPINHNPLIPLMQPKIKPSQYQPQLKLLSVDIETTMPTLSQPEQLYSIGFCGEDPQGNRRKQVFMLGDVSKPHPAWLQLFSGLAELLTASNHWLAQYDPDILIGWNVLKFDFTVLARIYREQGIAFNWGRGQTSVRLREGQNNRVFADIKGRIIVDGIDALKSASYHFDSFSLENVSRQLLGKGKEIETQDIDNRGGSMIHLFTHDKNALARYNLNDCTLVLDIFAKTKILNYLIQRAHLTGHTLDRLGGSVAAFEYLYLPKLHRAGYIAPSLDEGYNGFKAPGGFVMDSQPGLYHNVLVLDFKSLYPSIIRSFKIDPMGLIEGSLCQKEGSIDGFNDARFHRTQHFLPQIITDLWRERDMAKQHKDDATSHAIKIIMNSFYGVLGSNACRFFDARLASAITERGHEIIQSTAKWIENKGYQVIYGDTDSVFVHLNKKTLSKQNKQIKDNQRAQEIGQTLQAQLNVFWQKQLRETFDLDCHLEIEFETHYKTFLMPTIRGSELGSKKRYAGLMENDQLIFKGLEAVRSDWTALSKEVQTELYRRIFHHLPYRNYLSDILSELKKGALDSQLVYRKRIRRNLDDYLKNVPPQIQAARKAELFYVKQGKMPRYQYGGWIEYVITLAGPEPIDNIQNTLDYQHYIDKQLAPVADSILHFLGDSFHHFSDPQQDIFL